VVVGSNAVGFPDCRAGFLGNDVFFVPSRPPPDLLLPLVDVDFWALISIYIWPALTLCITPHADGTQSPRHGDVTDSAGAALWAGHDQRNDEPLRSMDKLRTDPILAFLVVATGVQRHVHL